MATLQSGQTISIQLAEGESYTVTPSGTAQVSTRGVSGSELSAPRTLTSAQTFGPYTEAGAISIACLGGTVDYTQAGGPVYQDPTTGALVGAGGLRAKLANQIGRPRIGCFGDSILGYQNTLSGTASSLTNNGDGTATIVFASAMGVQVGDLIGVAGAGDAGYHVVETPVLSVAGSGPYSYTYALAGAPAISPDSGGTPAIVYRFRKYQAGPTAWAQVLLMQDAEYVNLSIGGDTFAKMLDRFDRDVLGANLNRLLISAGVNDCFAAGLTLAQMQTNATAVFARAQALGIPVDVLTPPPQSSSRGGWTAGKRDVYKAFRNWLIQVCPSYGFTLIDSWPASSGSTTVINPTDANLNASTNVLMDLVHPSTIGAQAIGAKIAAVHRAFVPRCDRLVSNDADGNMIAGGLFQGSGGAPGTGGSGTVATGWTVSRQAGTPSTVCSTVARTVAADGDIIGNNQRMVITMGAANDTVRITPPSLHASVANGDRVRISCAVKLSATGCQFIKGLYLYVLSQTATTGNLQFYDLAYNSAGGFAYPDGFSGVFEIEAYVRTPQAVHGAPSSFNCYIEAIGAAAGECTVEIGRFTVVKAA